jgi:hypothetical protein
MSLEAGVPRVSRPAFQWNESAGGAGLRRQWAVGNLIAQYVLHATWSPAMEFQLDGLRKWIKTASGRVYRLWED